MRRAHLERREGHASVEPKGIWYVNQYAGGPGLHGAYRAYELTRRWRRAGFDAAVITGSFNNPPAQTDHYPPVLDVGGVPYVSIRTNRYEGNGLARILSILIFSVKLYGIGRRIPGDLARPAAVVISTVHPFGIFAGARLARRYRATLVFEIRDLWPLTLTTLLGKSRFSPLVLAAGLAQRYACRNADVVAALMPRAHHYFRDVGMAIGRFVWAPNGPSELAAPSGERSTAAARARAIVERWRSEGFVVMVHAGAIGPPNALDQLVDALIERRDTAKRDDAGIALLAIGDGVSRAPLETKACRALGESVHFSGRLSKEETQELIERCDIAWAGVRDVPELYRYGIALNKIPSYFSAGLPVLLPISPCGDAVSESGGGIAARMPDTDSLIDALEALVRAGPTRRAAMGEAGRRYVKKHYDYDAVATRLLDAIVASPSGPEERSRESSDA